jgi:5-methylcytosine-specific restriction endonuclease McrA
MSKQISDRARLLVYQKYDKHCAYCGIELEYKAMQIDHIIPRNTWITTIKNRYKIPNFLLHLNINDINHYDNLNPSCRRCNKWKCTFDLETFRLEISLQTKRLKENSSGYKLALDFNTIKEINQPIKFYFEK